MLRLVCALHTTLKQSVPSLFHGAFPPRPSPSVFARAPRPPHALGQVRTATKRAGGTIRNHGGSPGKRLGIKKFSDEYVIPGNIIVRQRGTQFHPGQHVKIGRDHTIYAISPGYVRFYTLPWRGGRPRRFVGVVLNRGEVLPRDETALGRSRYFGLVNVASTEQQSSEPAQHIQ